MNQRFSRKRTRVRSLVVLIQLGLLVAWVSAPRVTAHPPQENRQLKRDSAKQPKTVGQRRVALVIGNGAYENASRLANPANDATDIAAALRELGFELVGGRAHVNQNADQMKRLIVDFGDMLNGGGVGLFYYAGHGVQSQGHNYLIPVEANLLKEKTLEFDAVDVNRVLAQMDAAGNGFNIVILDACRNNPFSRSWRDASQGLAQVNALEGTLIAYATSPGRVANDGTGRNGTYTDELLKQMRTPGLKIEEMFKAVRAGVRTATKDQQTPWESSSLVGDFCLTGRCSNSGDLNDNETTMSAVSRVDPASIELSYWETIKNSKDANDFRAYLDKYPKGQFSELAKNRIEGLRAGAPKEPDASSPSNSVAEVAFWESIKDSTNPADFSAYVEKYPNGTFAQLARNRLAPFKAAESIAKQSKTFKGELGAYGTNFAGTPGRLVVSPGKILFLWDDTAEKPFPLECSKFVKARTDKIYIREIGPLDSEAWTKNWSYMTTARFKAESPTEAVNALDAVRTACSSKATSEDVLTLTPGGNSNDKGSLSDGGTVGPLSSADWQSTRGDGFSILMPKGSMSEARQSLYNGGRVDRTVYRTPIGQKPFFAVITANGINARASRPSDAETFDSYVDAFKYWLPEAVFGKGQPARLSLIGEKALSGSPGREYQVTVGDMSGTARAYFSGGRFVIAVALDASADQASQFFNSLTLR